jgi:predicted  nucleic acid-binding Zn-ribbon protein
MADVMPDYTVETIKLRAEIARLDAQLARYEQEYAEIESRKRKAVENWAATVKARKSTESNLEAMIEAHGDSSIDMAKLAKDLLKDG